MDDALPATPAAPPTSLEAIYERHVRSVYRFIYSKVGNREEAEDLTSQVFLKAARSLDQARGESSAQAWLFQVARTTIADHWRTLYRIHASSLDSLLEAGWEAPQTTPTPPVEEPSQRVERILARLPQRYREVLTYRFLLNYSLKETAAALGLTETNVKVLQFRALKKASQFNPNAEANS